RPPPAPNPPRPGPAQAGTVFRPRHFDFARLASVLPAVRGPRFAAVLPAVQEGTAGDRNTTPSASGSDGAPALGTAELANLLAALVARITHRDRDRIDRTQGLDSLGLDSLMATELVVALQSELAVEIPAMEVVNAGSINDLADRIRTLLGPAAAARP
ncbi:acyl carrier protein, partial [Streptomyces klenkii]